MAEERGDSRVSSFLVGFLVGSLLAGGGTSAYWMWQEARLALEAERRAVDARTWRAHTAMYRAAADTNRDLAVKERDRAEEAIKKLKER